MTLSFDASPPPGQSGTAVNPAKLRDEIHRLSQRLVRARESYNQDLLADDPEVPLDEQLAVIASYSAKLESVTEQLRHHDAGTTPPPEVPAQPSPIRAQQTFQPELPRAELPVAQFLQPAAPARHRAGPITGPGIANADGTPLVGDGGTVLRTEDAAVGEYVRHAADQRWLTATGRQGVDGLDAVCDGILAALAHKHGVTLEDERQRLERQVDARYRRDYG